jgi:hypothetical protein
MQLGSTPDPLMASGKVWDPQSWNRYTYTLNNPLRYVDPTGMKEVTAAQCAQDKNCVTVNVNVIYDQNSNNGQGLTDKQKSNFENTQLQGAKDQYRNADIHLNVTYTAGSITMNDKGMSISGLHADALNVVVTDQHQTDSGIAGKTPITFLNANSTDKQDLPHEMAHHFTGDMSSLEGRIMARDPIGLLRGVDMAAEDITNDYGRFVMNHTDSHVGRPVWNSAARDVQKSIQPTTH